ncbi:hypothetical protein OHB04_02240 [Streptomyces sp. NBC_01775]|uniref:hypothetical protein n=1 Tax=Streptomyces sp. NBC_01775 TaxID=2975939 RepID=UPI002DDBA55D|nr:hypothetical protein [Streptomyces sp. NBC_01775]WSB74712.1 hypothetical protein OHB04_02240 [Streptomyces sp. NBC_01775]
MLAVSERVKGQWGSTQELVWHKPVGPDPDATFQPIACSDEDGIVMRGHKMDVPLNLDKKDERWCEDCLAIARQKK